MEWIRFLLAAFFILIGVAAALIAAFGMFRFKFVLNRMHAAAVCDTCAILFVMIGLIIISGFNFTSLKFLLILFFLWIASPVSSHLISNMAVATNEHIEEECLVVPPKSEER